MITYLVSAVYVAVWLNGRVALFAMNAVLLGTFWLVIDVCIRSLYV